MNKRIQADFSAGSLIGRDFFMNGLAKDIRGPIEAVADDEEYLTFFLGRTAERCDEGDQWEEVSPPCTFKISKDDFSPMELGDGRVFFPCEKGIAFIMAPGDNLNFDALGA